MDLKNFYFLYTQPNPNTLNILLDIFENRIQFYGNLENQKKQYQQYLSDTFDIIETILSDNPKKIETIDLLLTEPIIQNHYHHLENFYIKKTILEFKNQSLNLNFREIFLQEIYDLHSYWHFNLMHKLLDKQLFIPNKVYQHKI